jgi:hypothetical protein
MNPASREFPVVSSVDPVRMRRRAIEYTGTTWSLMFRHVAGPRLYFRISTEAQVGDDTEPVRPFSGDTPIVGERCAS